MQYGIFYSNKMKKFIDENADNYDLIFFYHIRSSQYLPNYYKEEKKLLKWVICIQVITSKLIKI